MLRAALACALTPSNVVPTSATKKMAPAMRASRMVKPRRRWSGAVGFIVFLDARCAVAENDDPTKRRRIAEVLDRNADWPHHRDGWWVDARKPIEVESNREGGYAHAVGFHGEDLDHP